MSSDHDPGEAIGRIIHYFGHLSVAAVELEAPIITGHTTDLVQTVDSMEVNHQKVQSAAPGADLALHVNDHVREHDTVYREP
jgi:hypothetical protein